MSVSKSFVSNPENIRLVLELYLGDTKPTIVQVSKSIGTTFQNVQNILRNNVDSDRLAFEKALRYSRSKMSTQNPMSGKNLSQHHSYVGQILAPGGYLQEKINGQYVLCHRAVFAAALGIEKLPPWLDVHHIDENKMNNSIDNLALVSKVAHGKLHSKKSKL